MNWFNLGLTLDTLGKILLGVSVIMVHKHIYQERQIDTDVLRAMKKEKIISIFSIFLIILGYFLQTLFHFP